MSDSREARAVTIQKARNLLVVQADGLALWTEAEQDEAGDVIESLLSLLTDVLGSPRPEKDEKDQEVARVDRQCDPTDSPTASQVAPISTRMPGARKVTEAELAPFKKVMEEEVIPAIVEAVHRRAVSAAESRNKVIFRGPPKTIVDLRIALETEQTLKAAWEKRAYEAEAELAKLTASAEVVSPLQKLIDEQRDLPPEAAKVLYENLHELYGAEVVSPQEERLLVTQKFLDAMNATCREFAEVDEALGTPMDGTDEEAQAYRLATIAKLKSAEVVSPPKKSYVVHCGYDSAGILQRVADELPCRLTVREVVALRELLGNAPTAEVVSQPKQEDKC